MSYTFLERLQHYNESLTKVILLEISSHSCKANYGVTDAILFLYTAYFLAFYLQSLALSV